MVAYSAWCRVFVSGASSNDDACLLSDRDGGACREAGLKIGVEKARV